MDTIRKMKEIASPRSQCSAPATQQDNVMDIKSPCEDNMDVCLKFLESCKIGCGNFGVVYKVALKKCTTDDSRFKKEHALFKEIDHPNVCKFATIPINGKYFEMMMC